MGNIKRMIFGENIPSRLDPKYKDRYEKDLENGRRFARITRLDKLMGHIQCFANRRRRLSLVIVFAIILSCLIVNIYHLTLAFRSCGEHHSASQIQQKILNEKLQSISHSQTQNNKNNESQGRPAED